MDKVALGQEISFEKMHTHFGFLVINSHTNRSHSAVRYKLPNDSSELFSPQLTHLPRRETNF